MALKRLQSSYLAGYDYDAGSKTLTIMFLDGATFEYRPVEQFTADDLGNARSAGSYFHQHIKGKYPFVQV